MGSEVELRITRSREQPGGYLLERRAVSGVWSRPMGFNGRMRYELAGLAMIDEASLEVIWQSLPSMMPGDSRTFRGSSAS